ncbi:MAG: hypothetical protein AAGI23_18105 [Bacteroidota bacterium]
MNIDNLIENALDKVQSILPNAQLEYQYKPVSETHFIKITPRYLIDLEEIGEIEEQISDELDKLHPEQMFCFITEGSLVEIENPSRIVDPIRRNPYIEVLDILTVDSQVDDLRIEVVDSKFYQPDFEFLLTENAGNRQYAMAA